MKKLLHNLKSKPTKFLLTGLIAFSTFAFVDNYFEVSKNMEIFAALYKDINKYYVEDIDASYAMRTAIEAMLNELDPYTNYISEGDVESYRVLTTGQYGGIGALISAQGDSIIISDPHEGLPAQKAGLMAGDMIIEIDGKSTKNYDAEQVSDLMKGQAGTEVKITIRRPFVEKPLKFVVKREEIVLKSITWHGMIDANTGYIKLNGFKQGAAAEVQAALLELKKNAGFKTLIFDLRDNPGGSLDEAVSICGFFIPRNSLVVTTKGRNKEWDKTYKTALEPLDTNCNIAVLINKGSASASEIVSGVIQDYDRGVVVGQKSFGKGLVQTVRPLPYNAQLKVTTAKYYTPSGRCVQAISYGNKDVDKHKIPDSLKRQFKTINGRIVYDAGGVSPDLPLPNPEMSDVAGALRYNRYFFNYAVQYKKEHTAIAEPDKFELSVNDYNAFLDFVKAKPLNYTTETEAYLDEFKKLALQNGNYKAIEKTFVTLVQDVKALKQNDFQEHKSEIINMLTEEIAAKYYFDKGRLLASFKHDPVLIKAKEVIANQTLYNKTLNRKP